MNEKRQFKRVKIIQVLKGTIKDKPTEIIDGKIANISTGGIGITTNKILPIGTDVYLNFKLRDDLKFEYLLGKVNRINVPTENYIAIDFINLNEEEKHKLNIFISAIRFLRSIKQLKELTDEEIQLIVSLGKEEYFTEDQPVFHENMEANAFYIVLSGSIRIIKKTKTGENEVLTVIREGEYFGEMALLDDYNRSATAISHRNSTLLVIQKKRFRELMHLNKDISNKLLWIFVKTLCVRLREADKKMSDSFLLFAGTDFIT